MPAPIEFYFDFSSPYGYIAGEKIDAVAAQYGRSVTWRPFLLGVAFKTTGMKPLPEVPMKGNYAVRDFRRSAAYYGLPFNQPGHFPIGAVAATRAFYWLDGRDPARAPAFARALYRAYFVDNIDISSADNVIAVAGKFGLDAAETTAGINDAAVKDRTKAEVDRAIAGGAFGSPYIVVDGEPFWGSDRLDHVARWLETGGW